MKIQELEDAYGNPVILIDNGNGTFVSMPKENYDAQQTAVND
jgi:hypothetical protein